MVRMKQKKMKNGHVNGNNNKNKDPFASREAENYTSPIASREYLLELIGKDNKKNPSFVQLCKTLGLEEEDQIQALKNRLHAMVRDGQIIMIEKRYQCLEDGQLKEGTVTGHPDGHGFVGFQDGSPDLFLTSFEMQKVFPGDRVRVFAMPTGGRGKPEAKIRTIVSRGMQRIVGRVYEKLGGYYLKAEDVRVQNTIQIQTPCPFSLEPDQLVNVEILTYPDRSVPAVGRVVEVLGHYLDPGIEIQSAIRRFGLPHEWSQGVLDEIKGLTVEVSERAKIGRLDLRDLPLVTIDGEDARDFDDAVYCERLSQGRGFRLIVAIADVSYYVRPGTALDEEARLRGTSVYFPGEVIPMLPEILSNGLCSLNPEIDRLCLICEAELSNTGIVQRYRFAPAVMKSRARLTYTKVAALLVDQDPKLRAQYQALVPHLEALYELFEVLSACRQVRGAIDFDSTETQIEFDVDRKIKAIHPVVRNDAHRLIEECMLVANVAAADFAAKHQLPILFRNHAPPPELKMEALQLFLKPLGLTLRGTHPKPKEVAQLLERTRMRPDKHVLQSVVLRSMSQALYEPKNIGHYGLAYDAYTHFTSPIRRYPDLVLHRHIHHLLATDPRWQAFVLPDSPSRDAEWYFKNAQQRIDELGAHCSKTERRADEATRDVEAWLKCEYMQDKLGMTFKGTICGVTRFGIFVELHEFYVEGLVHVTDLTDDYYRFDERQHALVGERTHRCYALGDQITVQVARVNLESRHIDFICPDQPPRAPRGARVSQPPRPAGHAGAGPKKQAGDRLQKQTGKHRGRRRKR
jgi:ribonuclease R